MDNKKAERKRNPIKAYPASMTLAATISYPQLSGRCCVIGDPPSLLFFLLRLFFLFFSALLAASRQCTASNIAEIAGRAPPPLAESPRVSGARRMRSVGVEGGVAVDFVDGGASGEGGRRGGGFSLVEDVLAHLWASFSSLSGI